jgi:hypothetical protein
MIKNQRSFISKNSNSLNALIKKTSMTINRQNINGKKLLMTIVASITILGAVFTIGFGDDMTAFASKRQEVIDKSNGYPSGAHHNLNVHGTDPTNPPDCNYEPDSNSVWVANANNTATPEDERDENTIQYFSNKKMNASSDFEVRDPCSESLDGDPATVRIPYDEQGYYVYARVPGNHQNSPGSSLIMTPSPYVTACDFAADPDNPDYGDLENCDEQTDPDLALLGYVSSTGVYDYDTQSETFSEVDNSANEQGKGKGKSKATDITGLFYWTGFICEEDGLDGTIDYVLYTYDVLLGNNNGLLDVGDVPLTYDGSDESTANGTIETSELLVWMADLIDPLSSIYDANLSCTFIDNEWVLTIGDITVVDHHIFNDGVKLWKLRFYPMATTTFG